MAQAVECVLHKHEALSSNPSSEKKEKEKKERREREKREREGGRKGGWGERLPFSCKTNSKHLQDPLQTYPSQAAPS
jgi:hypothetical protein